MREYLKKHLINFKGQQISDKIVVIESDDWGAEGFPDKNSSEYFIKNKMVRDNPFARFDSLETSIDLERILTTLSSIKNLRGESPVITANWVMANPDFEKIEKDRYLKYTYESFLSTYKRTAKRQDNWNIIKEGINQDLIFPQFHAREHLNINLWMDYLKNNDKNFRNAFKRHCYSIDDSNNKNRRNNILATYDFYDTKELEVIKDTIYDGLRLFKDVFGFNSDSTVCPCYVWDNNVESFFDGKIKLYQGSKFQNIPLLENKDYKKKFHYIGEKINSNYYNIRNVLFEPSFSQEIDWVKNALKSIEIAFFWKKPAIIGMHRLNFSGNLSESNREENLRLFKILLKEIIRKWPEVKFKNSSELIDYFEK